VKAGPERSLTKLKALVSVVLPSRMKVVVNREEKQVRREYSSNRINPLHRLFSLFISQFQKERYTMTDYNRRTTIQGKHQSKKKYEQKEPKFIIIFFPSRELYPTLSNF